MKLQPKLPSDLGFDDTLQNRCYITKAIDLVSAAAHLSKGTSELLEIPMLPEKMTLQLLKVCEATIDFMAESRAFGFKASVAAEAFVTIFAAANRHRCLEELSLRLASNTRDWKKGLIRILARTVFPSISRGSEGVLKLEVKPPSSFRPAPGADQVFLATMFQLRELQHMVESLPAVEHLNLERISMAEEWPIFGSNTKYPYLREEELSSIIRTIFHCGSVKTLQIHSSVVTMLHMCPYLERYMPMSRSVKSLTVSFAGSRSLVLITRRYADHGGMLQRWRVGDPHVFFTRFELFFPSTESIILLDFHTARLTDWRPEMRTWTFFRMVKNQEVLQ